MKQSTLFALLSLFFIHHSYAQWRTVGDTTFGVVDQEIQKNVHLVQDIPHVVYVDYNDDALKLSVFENDEWKVPANGIADTDAGDGYFQSVTDANGIIYVVYVNDQVQVKKWDGSQWTQVGSADLGISNHGIPSIAIDGNGNPVIAFKKYVNFNSPRSLNLMTFNGTQWSVLDSNVADTTVSHAHMVVDKDDNIWVGYVLDNDSLFVKKYNGTQWDVVGTPKASAYRSFLHTNPEGDLWLRMRRKANQNEWLFFSYDSMGDQWDAIPSPNSNFATLGEVVNFDSWNVEYNPTDSSWYAGFVTNVDSKTFFKRWNGSSWSDVGSPVTPPVHFYFTSLTFDSNGNPYVSSAYNKVLTLEMNTSTELNDMQASGLTLYPNPVIDEVVFSGDKKVYEVLLTSSHGVRTKLNVINNACDLSFLKPGMFIIEYQCEGEVYKEKMMKY